MSESNKVYVGNCMVVLSPDGEKVLLAQRKKEPDMGGWQLPGGTVEYKNGENVLQAIMREVEEETGIKIENAEFLCNVNSFCYGNERPISIGFVGYTPNEEIPSNPEPNKATDWQWFSLSNIPEEKWFRMSRIAFDFYIKLKKEPTLDRFIIDKEYENCRS